MAILGQLGNFFLGFGKAVWVKISEVTQNALPFLVIENLSTGEITVAVESAKSVVEKLEGTAISNEVTTTNGASASTGPFSGTLKNLPVRKGSLSLSMSKNGGGTLQAKDDGAGVLIGSDVASGTVDYETGAISVTWASAATASAQLLASYQLGSAFSGKLTANEVTATNGGAPSAGPFSGTLAFLPVRPSTLFLKMAKDGGGTLYALDNGFGVLVGADVSNGTINYATGAVNITWASNAAAAAQLLASYQTKAMTPQVIKEGGIARIEAPQVLSTDSANLNPWCRLVMTNPAKVGFARVTVLGEGKLEFDKSTR